MIGLGDMCSMWRTRSRCGAAVVVDVVEQIGLGSAGEVEERVRRARSDRVCASIARRRRPSPSMSASRSDAGVAHPWGAAMTSAVAEAVAGLVDPYAHVPVAHVDEIGGTVPHDVAEQQPLRIKAADVVLERRPRNAAGSTSQPADRKYRNRGSANSSPHRCRGARCRSARRRSCQRACTRGSEKLIPRRRSVARAPATARSSPAPSLYTAINCSPARSTSTFPSPSRSISLTEGSDRLTVGAKRAATNRLGRTRPEHRQSVAGGRLQRPIAGGVAS